MRGVPSRQGRLLLRGLFGPRRTTIADCAAAGTIAAGPQLAARPMPNAAAAAGSHSLPRPHFRTMPSRLGPRRASRLSARSR